MTLINFEPEKVDSARRTFQTLEGGEIETEYKLMAC